MLFWILLIFTILGVAVFKRFDERYNVNWIAGIGMMISLCSGLGFVVCLIGILLSQIEANSVKQKYQEQYKGTMYKIESGIYQDDIKINDKDLVTEITNWNKNVIYYKSIQRDFWVGIFIPNIYDDFETIDYNLIKRR